MLTQLNAKQRAVCQTLLDRSGPIPAKDLAARHGISLRSVRYSAVARCLAESHHVVLATGRVHRAAARYADHWLDYPVWVIAGNGSVVRPAAGGAPIYERSIDRDGAAEVIRWAQSGALNLKAYLDDEMWVFEHRESSAQFCESRGIPYHVEPDLASVLAKGPTKMVLQEEPDRLDQLEVEARERWDARLSIIRSEPTYLEFMAPGVTKGLKSLISLMSMGAKHGEELLLRADGPDAAEAIAALGALLDRDLDA